MNFLDDPLHRYGHMSIMTEVFYALCRREQIQVIEKPLSARGFYLRIGERRYIALDSRLNGMSWLNVAFHEVGHHHLHAEQTIDLARFQKDPFYSQDPQQEREAEAFSKGSLIALLQLIEMERGGLR